MKIIEGFQAVEQALSRQMQRQELSDDEIENAVREIIADVRRRGDAALYDFTEKFVGELGQ